MKKWIVKQWISLAAVFGGDVPQWVRDWIGADAFKALSRKERELTQSLREETPRGLAKPAFLDEKIERGYQSSANQPHVPSKFGLYLIPTATLTMACIVALIVFINPSPQGQDEIISNEPVVTLIPEVMPGPVNEAVVSTFPNLQRKISDADLILKPLATEQARLASDMTNALRYVAKSILPEQYMAQVNENLASLEEGIGKSI